MLTREIVQTHDCFADEIAIDFPSVAPLVERVRDAFLGETAGEAIADAHVAEVSLSLRDASIGTIVPLEVPLRGLCRVCGGRGETWTEPCGDCFGTGEAPVQQPIKLPVPPGVVDGERLRFRVRSPHAVPLRLEVRIVVRQAA